MAGENITHKQEMIKKRKMLTQEKNNSRNVLQVENITWGIMKS